MAAKGRRHACPLGPPKAEVMELQLMWRQAKVLNDELHLLCQVPVVVEAVARLHGFACKLGNPVVVDAGEQLSTRDVELK